MFSLGPTNYGIYGLTVTMSVLTLAAITSPHPQQLAVARLVDTLVGCLISLAIGFALPAWKVTQLPRDVAAYCATLARRFGVLARAISQPPGERDPVPLRATGIETRDAVSHVLTTLAASSLEPAGQIPVARLRAAFDEVRVCGRLAIVAESLLNQRQPASATAAALARETATTLELVSDAVAHGRRAPVGARPSASGVAEIDKVLREALESANRAAQVGWGDGGAAP